MAAKKSPRARDGQPGSPVGLRKEYSGKVSYPSGFHRELSQPTSPWQRLVEDRRVELNLSLREVAERASTRARALGFNTLWSWLRRTDGHPPTKSYTASINASLARALELSADHLATAYEDSRRQAGLSTSAPLDTPSSAKLRLLRKLVSESRKATWKRSDLLSMIDDLLA